MRILAITNQKGGVGKTTSAVNLSAALAHLKQRVLLIDLDPQGNATTGCGIAKSDALPTVYQLLLGDTTLANAIQKTEFGFDILPANRELAGAEIELIELDGREQKLKEALATVVDRYDYVLIDCPPALNMLTVNALVASKSVMIPMQCEYYALEGLSDLVETLRKVRENLNPELEIEGLLRTMYNAQSTLTQQVSDELTSHFGNKVYSTIIPRNVRLAEAPSHGKPAMAYDASSKGAQAYGALAEELLGRHGKSTAKK
ncbi:MAG: ParA family protein [Rhodocyclaceae bacterium]|jgi:chromosome partitioning protein|uniref:Chromosome partitioning protein ParA n=1 Tax=Fluviibacter phosphoraccumulans TaxID=1751046 RepID=A0A679IFH9_9RHOO|nr:AAA family ATPase [Fluviibacter phosphoraccumulans]MBP7917638.1 ParA family protein [Rhodocyclaceae bacterium]BBU68252.1 chromosome partitioning protein ParA [Fluviibacter phosphoraccumulans]BBU70209.1 chromosome partitioning protein ParA [Fluviibacter phosphoraccumulans]BCA66435.1 chromosome partitioning protein ParA [Fluviibacter phosphoraccumulans]